MPALRQPVTGGIKRQRDETDKTVESSSSPLSPTKQVAIHLQNRFPYERLSKLFFTRRALRDFDQQTPRATFPSPPEPLQLHKPFPTLEELGIDRAHHLESGGPGLGDLRGYFNPKEPSSQSYTQDSSDEMPGPEKRARAKKSSAYDQNFNQLFIDHGSFPVAHCHRDNRPDPKPANLEELNEVLQQRRPSLSPSCFTEENFRDFWQKAKNRSGETQVMGSVFPIIRGNAKIPYVEDKLFRNLDPFTEGIVIAKPDFYDGANPNDLDQQVREELGRYIIPSVQKDAPILPNFFAEGKGNEGSDAVAERQALYDGTLGARAIQHLQSYRKKSLVYDNKAYTITSTYHHGHLMLYATYPTRSTNPERSTKYNMVQLGDYSLIHNGEAFRQGAAALRNARDWAKAQRDHFIAAANEAVKKGDEEEEEEEPAASFEASVDIS